jgi:hypothetical protein
MALMLWFGREWSAVGRLMDLVTSRVSSDKANFFPIEIFSKKKRKKRKSSMKWRFQKKSSFFEKILPEWSSVTESS